MQILALGFLRPACPCCFYLTTGFSLAGLMAYADALAGGGRLDENQYGRGTRGGEIVDPEGSAGGSGSEADMEAPKVKWVNIYTNGDS